MDISSIEQGLLAGQSESKLESEFESLQDRALKYLREKFPGVDDGAFFTGYSGNHVERLSSDLITTILTCQECERLCAKCEGPRNCEVKNFLKSYLRPSINLCTNPRGRQYLEVRKSNGLRCKFGAYDLELARLVRKSGLSGRQLNQTFESYMPQTEDQVQAKRYMMALSKLRENVILAGKRGTGKSHLSVAFALSVMRDGNSQAKFELVAEMLDKIRRAIFERQDYFALIESYKRVDYLVLDDLGKEKQTDAASDYLFQIIDSRYRNMKPTIITTNARTPDELASWGRPDIYAPMISRLLENGMWLAFTEGSDYRLKAFNEVAQNAQ